MFYREYRPQKFSDLIGSDQIVSIITSALAQGKPAHAYFFSGSRGIGKTTTARLVAKSLNCINPKLNVSKNVFFEPCGKCDACMAIENGRYLDLIEIDAASNRGIDNIREITDKVGLAPSQGKNKVYIIDEVHMLTTEASNALLKTLEEPPEHVYFILCTTNPEKVLDTIKSRCQQFVFKRPTKEEIKTKLQKISEDKGEVAEEYLNRIASAAKGAFRDAETMLEQFLSGKSESFLDYNSQDFNKFLSLISNGQRKEALELINISLNSELNFESWTEKLIQYLRALMLFKSGFANALDDYQLNENDINLVKSFKVEDIKNYLVVLSKRMEDFRYVNLPSLPIEVAVIDLTSGIVESEPKIKPSPVKDSGKEKAKITEKAVEKLQEVIEKKAEPAPAPRKPRELKDFPIRALMDALMESNPSLNTMLISSKVIGFDGENLTIGANHLFHKERLMSVRTRGIIEDACEKIAGRKIVLHCELINKHAEASNLTDLNVKVPGKDASLEKIFEEVFGDDVTIS